MLLAGGVDRRLYAIDAGSGAKLWETDQLNSWVWGAPLLSGDAVYFTTLDGQVHGHRVDNGQPLWSPVVLKGSISAGPIQAGESIRGRDGRGSGVPPRYDGGLRRRSVWPG